MLTRDGIIELYKNVPLTNSYEHTIDFKTKTEQKTYFAPFLKYQLTNYSYIRREREYISVELSISALDDVNYLYFIPKNGERAYYAFIVDKVYVNDNNTNIFFEIDVFQSFMFDYQFKESYIAQAHVDRWTAEHKPIYSKTAEDVDYGTDYAVENSYTIKQDEDVFWFLVSFLRKDRITFSTYGSTGLCYALVPCLRKHDERGVYVSYYDTNGAVKETDGLGIADWSTIAIQMRTGLFAEHPIQSIQLLPYNPFIESKQDILPDENNTLGGYRFTFNGSARFEPFSLGEGLQPLLCFYKIDEVEPYVLARTSWKTGISESLPTDAQWAEIKAKPYTTKRDKRFESKLLCYPYRYNLLTDWRTTPATIKNEYLPGDNIELKMSLAPAFNVSHRFWVEGYKKDVSGRYTSVLQPLALEQPVFSDQYAEYMLANRNTIQQNVLNATINATATPLINAAQGAVLGRGAGAVVGGVGGLVEGGISLYQTIASENAKQADIKNLPDNVIGSNDSSFNIIDKSFELMFYRFRICCENEAIVAEWFNMCGYKIKRVEVPNIRSRTRFNFIRTVGANITGPIPTIYLEKLRTIFDKGVTIWHYTSTDFNPFDYSYENIEVNLL